MEKGHLLQRTCLYRATLLALGAAAVPISAVAAPTGGMVSAGSAVISAEGNKTDIHQSSDRAVLDWQQFDIDAGEHAEFHQPSSSSIALNRIHSDNASQILGKLSANGTVVLVNPNGVMFGAGSEVNVGSLVATTADTDNERFMDGGELVHDQPGNPTASIVNNGTITAKEAGLVGLVAPNVVNNGVIEAKLGKVQLSSGDTMTVDFYGDGLINVEVSDEVQSQLVKNTGTINAEGGSIIMTAEAGAQVAGSLINMNGTLDVSSETGNGGTILITADDIILEDGTRLRADGRTGGGRVRIGGEYQGGGDTYRADNVNIDANTRITANALEFGSGGEVIVWADVATWFNGIIEAKGTTGNGGLVETSGKKTLKVGESALVNTLSILADVGLWLLDPQDFTIAASGGDITGATITSNLASSNVTLLSSNGGTSGSGDININDVISWGSNLLTLTAARDININAVMTATGTAALTMNTATANGGDSAVTGGVVRVGMAENAGGFTGRVDYSSSGTLTINTEVYTVLNSLGAQGSVTGTDLQGIRGNLAGRYVLGSNIDASATSGWNAGAGFVPLGDLGTTFTGKFNGLGHTVSGLTINRTGTSYVGLVGRATTATSSISNVGLTGINIAGNSYTGGVVGLINGGALYNSFASGTVSGSGYVGGLAGFSNTDISNAYSTGTVTSLGNYTGGLVGYYNKGTGTTNMADSYSTATVNGTSVVGGLIGDVQNGANISDSFATGNVTGSGATVGGLLGRIYQGVATVNYATGNVSGQADTGGLIGVSDSAIVSLSYATGTVAGTSNVGGLLGNNTSNVINNYATGNVTSTSGNSGGLLGFNNTSGFLMYNYATGNVNSSGTNSGGFVGENKAIIQHSYATGNVTNTNVSGYSGGFVGYNSLSIDSTYSIGTVSGPGTKGGLAGRNTSTISNSFWDTETSGLGSSVGGTGKTTAQMKDSTTYTAAGWDFTSIWGIRDYLNNAYPVLRILYTNVTIDLLQSTSKTYGDANPTLALGTDYSITGCTGCMTLDFGSGLTAASDVGTYNYGNGETEGTSNLFALTLNTGVLTDYFITYDYGDGSLNTTVNKANLNVSLASSSYSRNQGESNPAFVLNYSGFKLSDTASVLDSLPTASTSANSSSAAGLYNVLISGGSDNNYNLVFSNPAATLEVLSTASESTPTNTTNVPGSVSKTVAYAKPIVTPQSPQAATSGRLILSTKDFYSVSMDAPNTFILETREDASASGSKDNVFSFTVPWYLSDILRFDFAMTQPQSDDQTL